MCLYPGWIRSWWISSATTMTPYSLQISPILRSSSSVQTRPVGFWGAEEEQLGLLGLLTEVVEIHGIVALLVGHQAVFQHLAAGVYGSAGEVMVVGVWIRMPSPGWVKVQTAL